ncbi:hypothetical protein C8R45DRAFT_1149894 [Mycena sanguinolenta]|nr:hypothetical protein C8R45DRAFT_1149894 [Mycena sanguinolenta]
MSGNAIYHAATWGHYNAVYATAQASTPPKSAEDAKRLTGQVLVSVLAVSVGLASSAEEPAKQRLTALLGLTKPPMRASLLKDALVRDVLHHVPVPIKQLYDGFEVTFDPLTLCVNVAPILAQLRVSADYAPYVPLLQWALPSWLLSQLAQDTTDKEKPKTGSMFDPEQVESYIMGCVQRGELSVSVDHADGSITFMDDPFVDMIDDSHMAKDNTGTGVVRDEDGAVQPSVMELVRTRLGSVTRCLNNALEVITPPPAHDEAEAQARFAELAAEVKKEHKALQLRRALVARRRELLSELSIRKEKEEAIRRADVAWREKDDETKRAKEEARRHEQEKIIKIQVEMKQVDPVLRSQPNYTAWKIQTTTTQATAPTMPTRRGLTTENYEAVPQLRNNYVTKPELQITMYAGLNYRALRKTPQNYGSYG